MTAQGTFLNRLRSLFNIDGDLLPELTTDQQHAFIRDPVRYLMKADDAQAAAIFREIEKRQPTDVAATLDGDTGRRDGAVERPAYDLEYRLWQVIDREGVLPLPSDIVGAVAQLAAKARELDALINTPEIGDFLEGVKREAAHQVQRWGEAHDRSKSAENWFFLIGFLAGKALRAAIEGDRDKAKHHTISSAGALYQWFLAIQRDESGAGIGKDSDLKPAERS